MKIVRNQQQQQPGRAASKEEQTHPRTHPRGPEKQLATFSNIGTQVLAKESPSYKVGKESGHGNVLVRKDMARGEKNAT